MSAKVAKVSAHSTPGHKAPEGQDATIAAFRDEKAIMEAAQKFKAERNEVGFQNLIYTMRDYLPQVSKARAAKLVRALVDLFLEMEDTDPGLQIQVCKECIEWATNEKRSFLRQSLESRLVAVYHDTAQYSEALALGSTLLKELKKMDDKNLLVEVQLLESKTYHALGNLPRARAALTSARTTANSIYCPPLMQAALDLQSGILHAADEKDFKTAYSYFYEAFEGLNSVDAKEKALVALKYMLLSKIMLNKPEEVPQLLTGKLTLTYGDMGEDVEAMKAVATAAQNRSLAEFQTALHRYKPQLENDPIVKTHFATLYDKMLEQNLSRIIEPYSKVEVSHIAQSIKLPIPQVENKLSQMILDKKLSGVLDQGAGMLVIFDSTQEDKAYEAALELIHNMGKVVDALYHKAKQLT